jgi:hypothetical protein
MTRALGRTTNAQQRHRTTLRTLAQPRHAPRRQARLARGAALAGARALLG